MLAWTIYLSFLGAAAAALLPTSQARIARLVALLTALAGLLCTLASAALFQPGQILTITRMPWIPSLGIQYFLAADGISLTLVLLTGIAAVVGVLFSWNLEHRAPEFFAFYLALIGGVYGVFLSFDLFLLFVFYEIAIIPKYFLIAIWGSTRKEHGAMKLALYSFVGSGLVLIGLLAAFVMAGAKSFSLLELAKHPFPGAFQMWAFPLVFVGFGILAGLWPFHTWAPTGHVAAPTAASMLLAGVVMKLGAYGCLRVALVLFPHGLDPWGSKWLGLGSWRDLFCVLAVVGIVYGAMVALVQRDFKFVIGYSSVSHMGFVLLGLLTLHRIGLSGAVLQMFSHGIIAGLLFAVVGRMVYDRAHTRQLPELQALSLGRALPFAAVTFTLAGFASMGLPGFSGFIAELQVLIGAWHASPNLALLAGIGIVIGVAYTLRALQQAFLGERSPARASALPLSQVHSSNHPAHPPAAQTHARPINRDIGQPAPDPSRQTAVLVSPEPEPEPTSRADLPAISVPERIGALILLGTSLVVGLFPRLLLDWIGPSLNSPLFERLWSIR